MHGLEGAERQRAYYLRHKYRLDWPDYVRMQAEGCRICGGTEPVGKNWHIDHDPACCPPGKNKRYCGECIRGLLCLRCNCLLGYAQDSTEILKKAINYLEATSARY